jgi:hypothetical protein
MIGRHHIVPSVLLPVLRMGTAMLLLLLLPGAMGTVSKPSAFVHDQVFRVTVTSYSGSCLCGDENGVRGLVLPTPRSVRYPKPPTE